ncbi:AMP-binding protein [Paenibacillus sp. D2_2]|uniref:AMP-binding protein n=1 Tax=Paenibacillus sp. D2_2 TaxID=3073092 RepID=UPI0028168F33|nr:AMP-binding protein [Paenibacillus sp. D2_2]WMT43116.1 AMP-binding protein [Paenibacillus sp. D2_2]
MNLLLPILQHALQEPNRIAISSKQGKLTYAALVQRVRQVAQGIMQNGMNHDKIAILSTNRQEFVEVFLGAVYAGFVPVLLDPKWSSVELNEIIGQCQPSFIFAETAFASKITLQSNDSQIIEFSDEPSCSYEKWLTRHQAAPELNHPNELLFIGFTSGTTGIPKGFMRTHLSWIRSFEATNEAFQLVHLQHFTAPGPFVHSLSLFALMQSLYNGATFHIVQQFNAAEVLSLCSNHSDMVLFAVPTMIDSLISLTVPGHTHIQALISSGGTWSEHSKQRCREVFNGVKLYEYYGSSEASYISYLNVNEDNKLGSVGRPFTGVEISIRDEHFQEVAPGSIGQLYIRSDMMFLGYYQLPEETATVFQNGWLKTGDFMFIDSDGFLYMTGRSKNMMVTGGLNVIPEEVEAVLQRIPAIREVMVFGIPNHHWGEMVTAIVQWRGDQRLTIDELKAYCRENLASYKAPKQLITVDQFIYTSSGKIARHAMKEYLKRVES